MRFYDVPVNRSVPTEANRGLTSYNQSGWYALPALFQRFTKALSLLLSHTVVIVLWVELVHALLEVPPEVLNWVEI
jgi:hypothetical protein